ncbi:hypothetical protein BJ138DRAFT_1148430 [Hygrophoropsis aurantiaca]|uniref:Uncharacterized protein n=1 Tax=Hygrophoropsis aurantiaca TaxID=72124 RepID=A0ACB8AGV7_9AGAM|nr:hypothetical protein BJ138DRAFT_1148430 [Hygrophoropsis aurantiaca]
MASQAIQEVTPLVVSEAVARAQEQIDKKITSLSKQLLELRSQRNAITHISFLPPELLAKVFVDYAYMAYKENRGKSSRSRSLMWIRVTHVCRHWRQVALAFPALWTLLVLENSSWTEQMLIRSKMAPLVIDVDLNHFPKSGDTAGKALKHISRVREFRLAAPHRAMGETMALLINPAPLLESLTLSDNLEGFLSYLSAHVLGSVAPYTATRIPADLFGGYTPSLRKVTFKRCQFTWPSSLLVDLTHLDIRHLISQFRPSLSQLVSCLNRMPALRRCILEDVLPLLPENAMPMPTVPIEERVSLLALESLYLGGTLLECVQIIAHLNLPKNINLKLTCVAAPGADGLDFSPLFPFISHLGRGDIDDSSPPCATFQSMIIGPQLPPSGGKRGAFIWCTTSEQQLSFTTPAATILTESHGPGNDNYHFRLNALWNTYSPMGPISSICGVLSLSNIRHLIIHGLPHLSEEFWLQSFCNAQNLKEITVGNSSVNGFVKALANDAPDGYQPGDKAVFLPSLDSIALECVEFDGTQFIDRSRGVTPKDLHGALVVRANQGANIKRLAIKECHHLFSDDANLLKEVVVDFVWDQIEHYDGESSDEYDGEFDEDSD